MSKMPPSYSQVSTAALTLVASFSLGACSVVAPATAKDPIATDNKALKLEGDNYIEYRAGIKINAPADKIWALLTDAPNYPSWNSTVTQIDGTIAAGQSFELSAKIAPDRTFPLRVSTFDAPKHMVWEDGGDSFRGVRTFHLTQAGDGSTEVTMSEVLSGWMMPMIEGSLPDFRPAFEAFLNDLKTAAEAGA